MKTICLFCASLDGKDPLYSKTAKEFGIVLAEHQCSFLYGGGSLGLMGLAAKSALKNKTTLKTEALKSGLIDEKNYDKIVDPKKMIYPS